jgi:predicted phosphohydrolase
MRLFAIGDTHLPSARGKDMHRFGWAEHPLPLQRAWDALVAPTDVVIVAGDISWATRPTEVQEDLAWLDARPGRKVLLKGNHDYWWGDSLTRLKKLLAPYPTLEGVLHNCAVEMGPWLIAGTRLWTTPEAPPMPGGEMGDEPADQAYVERETRRLQLSIQDAELKRKARPELKKIAAVHFPPLYAGGTATAFSSVIEAWQPGICVYGHLHAEGIAAGFQGVHGGVPYKLVSCDAAGFSPVLLDEV